MRTSKASSRNTKCMQSRPWSGMLTRTEGQDAHTHTTEEASDHASVHIGCDKQGCKTPEALSGVHRKAHAKLGPTSSSPSRCRLHPSQHPTSTPGSRKLRQGHGGVPPPKPRGAHTRELPQVPSNAQPILLDEVPDLSHKGPPNRCRGKGRGLPIPCSTIRQPDAAQHGHTQQHPQPLEVLAGLPRVPAVSQEQARYKRRARSLLNARRGAPGRRAG